MKQEEEPQVKDVAEGNGEPEVQPEPIVEEEVKEAAPAGIKRTHDEMEKSYEEEAGEEEPPADDDMEDKTLKQQ